jgi:hypothetical protein
VAFAIFGCMNVLVLYDRFETYTNTVFEHLDSFRRHSNHRHFYVHARNTDADIAWDQFDALVIHYCIRVVFDLIPNGLLLKISEFKGPKILFVQDEYDLTHNIWKSVRQLGISNVFTCVPADHRHLVYPPEQLPNVRFIQTLTGYIPNDVDAGVEPPRMADRPNLVGYRGRALPYFYGDLGQEKLAIAKGMREACEARGVPFDIEWDEDSRIYGAQWPKFLMSCKATLGTESGANLFDFDGGLRRAVSHALANNPKATYEQVKLELGWEEEAPIMNQISPRFFEAIAFKTALVLFEGSYSGILRPWEHYIPLRKDFSNLDLVFKVLSNNEALDLMVNRAHEDVIGSGLYTYQKFVQQYDSVLDAVELQKPSNVVMGALGKDVTLEPSQSKKVVPAPYWLLVVWNAIPWAIRRRFTHFVNRIWFKMHER